MAGTRVAGAVLSANTGAGATGWNAGNLGAAVQTGDKIVAVLMLVNNGVAPVATGITDSLGNVWIKDITPINYADGAFNVEHSVWSTVSSGGTPSNITVAWTGTAVSKAISVGAYRGLLAVAGPSGVELSKSANGTGSGVNTADSGTSAASTSAAGLLKIGFYSDDGWTTTVGAGTLDTAYSTFTQTVSNGNGETSLEDATTGAAGTTARATASPGAGAVVWGMSVVVYKLAEGGGGASPLPFQRNAGVLSRYANLFRDYTYKGVAPTGVIDTLLEPAAATMTFSGQAPALASGLNPANGTMTFTGQTSPVNSTIVPAAASMVFSGQTATLASVINPANATMVFTGQTAREDTVLNPANATMVFTGQTGTVNVGALLTPAAASMTFTGQATALAVSINPAAGTMIFTGQTATLAHVLNPAPATMIFTGQGPRLDSVLMPVNATMVFTGQATRLDTVLNPTPASVSFTGQTPTVTAGGDILLNPAAASMVFTGQLATVSVASPPGGSFQLIFLKESGQMAKRIDAAGRMYEELGG